MTLKWSENVTLKFLEEYKNHECLWNQNSTQYYDCCSKKKALKEIIGKLKIPSLTEGECQNQLEAISKKYTKEQSKILHGLRSGKLYKSNLPWYSLMQEMLTKTFFDEDNAKSEVTICTNLVADKKKIPKLSKKRKTKFNVLSPANQITPNNPCGYKIQREIVKLPSVKNNHQKKKLKKQTMNENCKNNYVQCPGFGNNNLLSSLDENRSTGNIFKTGSQNNPLQESVCVREIKKRRDISKINKLHSQSNDYSSSGCKNLEDNHYAAKAKFCASKNMIPCPSYFNKQNNSDLNYNDYKCQNSNDQHRYQTIFVPCHSNSKPADDINKRHIRDQLYSPSQNNAYNYFKNNERYCSSERICTNNFDKTAELYPSRQVQKPPEHDTNINKPCCVGNSIDFAIKPKIGISLTPEINNNILSPTYGDQGILEFTPIAAKLENGVIDAYSQFKISIQCSEKRQCCKKIPQKSCQETQTVVEIKQQSVCTNKITFDSKETQHDGTQKRSKQTGMEFVDCNKRSQTTVCNREIQNTVCISKAQAEKLENNLNDYILLKPGGKYVRLVRKCMSKENFVPCQGASEHSYIDDESFSFCTEGSCIAQEPQYVDSVTMTKPQLIQCIKDTLHSNVESKDKQSQDLESDNSSKAENAEPEEKNKCEACKNGEDIDDDIKLCFEKVLNKELSDSDCFPCLREKIANQSTGELTKTFLCILKCALDMDSKTEINNKGCKFQTSSKTEILKKIFKCLEKLLDIEATKRAKKNNLESKYTQIEKSTGCSKEVTIEQKPSTSRSTNTFIEETPVEITQTILENEETNTDFSNLQTDAATNPMETLRLQDASTQSKAKEVEKVINKAKSIGTQKRDPILVRIISATENKTTTQSESSQCTQSEIDEIKKHGCRRVCFNEKKEFENSLEKYFKCGKECNREVNCDWTKVRITGKSNYKIRKKILEKKLAEIPKDKYPSEKIFFSDFRI